MKYKHIKGLELQKPAYLLVPNRDVRKLLNGEEVEVEKEAVEQLEGLGVKLEEVSKERPKKKIKKQRGLY